MPFCPAGELIGVDMAGLATFRILGRLDHNQEASTGPRGGSFRQEAP